MLSWRWMYVDTSWNKMDRYWSSSGFEMAYRNIVVLVAMSPCITRIRMNQRTKRASKLMHAATPSFLRVCFMILSGALVRTRSVQCGIKHLRTPLHTVRKQNKRSWWMLVRIPRHMWKIRMAVCLSKHIAYPKRYRQTDNKFCNFLTSCSHLYYSY